MIDRVVLSRRAKKEMEKIPFEIFIKVKLWMQRVRKNGLENTKKYPGYHDELLQGKRWGQRSARLNRGYRIFYSIRKDDDIFYVYVGEVNKHEY
jgi:toxin HigB-1